MVELSAVNRLHTDLDEARNGVVFGAQKATRFIRDMVAGKSINGKKYNFDDKFVIELHRRLYYCEPNAIGGLRKVDLVTVSGKEVTKALDLHWKFPLFGRWLKESTDKLAENPENLIGGLEVAAAAHYGIVMPELHPFENGNGRTGRSVMNAVLMSQTYELTAFGLAIPPVPILRMEGDNTYVRALQKVDDSKDLQPFMVFIAKKWVNSLEARLSAINESFLKINNKMDRSLVNKLNWRRARLNSFIDGNIPGNPNPCGRDFPVPDYFELRHIRQ